MPALGLYPLFCNLCVLQLSSPSAIRHLPATMLAFSLFLLFTLDRLFKHVAVVTLFGHAAPVAPDPWPTVSRIQPITRSPNDLQAVLRARTQLVSPGAVQQILVYDAQDAASLAVIEQVQRDFPGWGCECVGVQQP